MKVTLDLNESEIAEGIIKRFGKSKTMEYAIEKAVSTYLKEVGLMRFIKSLVNQQINEKLKGGA